MGGGRLRIASWHRFVGFGHRRKSPDLCRRAGTVPGVAHRYDDGLRRRRQPSDVCARTRQGGVAGTRLSSALHRRQVHAGAGSASVGPATIRIDDHGVGPIPSNSEQTTRAELSLSGACCKSCASTAIQCCGVHSDRSSHLLELALARQWQLRR
jgi:hypothetical protein